MVPELIEQLQLTPYAKKAVHTYSGGTQRKLSLAVAMLGNPQMLYLVTLTQKIIYILSF